MMWEQAPDAGGPRSWLWRVVVAVVAAIALTGAEPVGTVAAGPTDQPAQGLEAPAIDHSDFAPLSLEPLAAATHLTGDGPLVSDAPDLMVVTTDDEQMSTVSLMTGDIVRRPLMAGSDALDPWTLFAVGDSLITHAGHDVVRLADQGRRPVRLARGHLALPTVDDVSIWVFEDRPRSRVMPTLVRLGLDGSVIDRIPLPAAAQPEAGVGDGVLLSTPSGIHIASGGGVRRITTSGQLVAAGVDRLAWLDCDTNLSCQIVIGSLANPDQVRVAIARTEVPGGTYGLALGRFSADGRRLALPVLRFDAGPEVAQTAVTIIDTVTGAEVSRIPAPPAQAFEGTPLDWSPDGRLLFVGLGTSLSAWDAHSGGLTRLDVGRTPIRGVAVVQAGAASGHTVQ